MTMTGFSIHVWVILTDSLYISSLNRIFVVSLDKIRCTREFEIKTIFILIFRSFAVSLQKIINIKKWETNRMESYSRFVATLPALRKVLNYTQITSNCC